MTLNINIFDDMKDALNFIKINQKFMCDDCISIFRNADNNEFSVFLCPECIEKINTKTQIKYTRLKNWIMARCAWAYISPLVIIDKPLMALLRPATVCIFIGIFYYVIALH